MLLQAVCKLYFYGGISEEQISEDI